MRFAKLESSNPAVSDDIRSLYFDSYSVEAALIDSSDFPPLKRTSEAIQSTESTFFGIITGDRLVAVCETERLSPDKNNIAGFAVHPSVFRQGVGSRLLVQVLELLGGQTTTVSTARLNKPAIALYAKHGFQESKRWATQCGIAMVSLVREAE